MWENERKRRCRRKEWKGGEYKRRGRWTKKRKEVKGGRNGRRT